jgi:hypothetical protein
MLCALACLLGKKAQRKFGPFFSFRRSTETWIIRLGSFPIPNIGEGFELWVRIQCAAPTLFVELVDQQCDGRGHQLAALVVPLKSDLARSQSLKISTLLAN